MVASAAWIAAILIVDAVNYSKCEAMHFQIVKCGPPGVTLILAPPCALLLAMLIGRWIARGFAR